MFLLPVVVIGVALAPIVLLVCLAWYMMGETPVSPDMVATLVAGMASHGNESVAFVIECENL